MNDQQLSEFLILWAACPILDAFERSLVTNMQGALSKGRNEYDKVVEGFWENCRDQMTMAIEKARLQGIGRHA